MNSPLYVITGATGHIGYALLKKMESLPVRIRILIRKDTPIFDGIDCEKVYGDVTDPDSLVRAFTGADVVFHLAGIIDINVGNEDAIWRVNFEGTKNVVRAAQKCGVRRIVYASSVDAFEPLPGNQLMRETDEFDPDKLDGTYAKTKAAATNFVLHTCKTENLDAVIVYPGACIGPYDFKVSNAGEMVRMFMRGSFPVSLAFGAYNFVDVRDVADGMIAAAEKGKSGEGYILCGEQITTHGFIKTVAEVCGKKCPKIRRYQNSGSNLILEAPAATLPLKKGMGAATRVNMGSPSLPVACGRRSGGHPQSLVYQFFPYRLIFKIPDRMTAV